MGPRSARVLAAFAPSVMAAVPVDSFDPVALALAIGREERAMAAIAVAAVAELERAGYTTTAGM